MKFVWPLEYHYITRDFDFVSSIYVKGDNGVRMHAALDLVRRQGATAGQEVKAIALGIVVGDAWDKYSGYFIVLEHEGGWRSTYRHLVTDAPPVVGQPVVQGQTIGYVGSTGLSSGPHLHIDLWHRQPQDPTAHAKVGWWAHDPELYLGQEDDDMGMTEAEKERMEALFSQVSYLRARLGMPPQFDESQAHESPLLKTIAWLVTHANDANFHHSIQKIKDAIGEGTGGLKRGDRVNIKDGTLE